MKTAIVGSKSLYFQHRGDPAWKPINYKNTLYMATIGGAAALQLTGKVGRFEVSGAHPACAVLPPGTSRLPAHPLQCAWHCCLLPACPLGLRNMWISMACRNVATVPHLFPSLLNHAQFAILYQCFFQHALQGPPHLLRSRAVLWLVSYTAPGRVVGGK